MIHKIKVNKVVNYPEIRVVYGVCMYVCMHLGSGL